MPYDYSIKPCSSAQPMRNSDPTSPSFGEIIKPIRYNGVGCPAVILNTGNMLCKNGSIFNPSSAITPCNERSNKNDCDVTFFNNIPCDWNESNSTCKSTSFTNEDVIRFRLNEIVYIEDVLFSIKHILNSDSVITFLDWNQGILDDLANVSRGCGSSSNIKLKGRIKAITNNILGNGRIKWGDMEFYRNIENYPNAWPNEIFWIELDNGTDVGLENFNIGAKAENVYYQEMSSEDYINVIDLKAEFGGKSLLPVLRSQITNLQTRMSVQKTSTINRSQIMNTPRFRRTGSCGTGSLCLDTTLTPSFKNSTKNMYLAPIPYGQRLGNTFRSSQLRGTKKIVRKNCVDPQFGRLVGTGGSRLVNKF